MPSETIELAAEPPFTLLEYTPDDRWIVCGQETASPLMVLSVVLMMWVNETVGEA